MHEAGCEHGSSVAPPLHPKHSLDPLCPTAASWRLVMKLRVPQFPPEMVQNPLSVCLSQRRCVDVEGKEGRHSGQKNLPLLLSNTSFNLVLFSIYRQFLSSRWFLKLKVLEQGNSPGNNLLEAGRQHSDSK